KANIDCLAMSATPIPRTLHMSLLKIRDMSLLATPPANRQAIETVIDAYRDDKREVAGLRPQQFRGEERERASLKAFKLARVRGAGRG
ncbi:hypothetical protein, partial [Treponema endosymbiont of Eucomonympha sp.]|uniref:hypothetical protein n=1 Tax=Treponema endosymbiont of Eucomonympha sp. TaxID=1580831 RepID=UPI000B03FABD